MHFAGSYRESVSFTVSIPIAEATALSHYSLVFIISEVYQKASDFYKVGGYGCSVCQSKPTTATTEKKVRKEDKQKGAGEPAPIHIKFYYILLICDCVISLTFRANPKLDFHRDSIAMQFPETSAHDGNHLGYRRSPNSIDDTNSFLSL